MLSFCFYTRTFSVLFPSNKYQIKVDFPFFRLFQKGLRCAFFCAGRTRVRAALGLTLEAEAGRPRRAAPRQAQQTPLLPFSQTVFGPPSWPRAAAPWRDVVHIRSKHNYQHTAQGRKGDGGRDSRRWAVGRMGAQKPTK